LAGIALALSIPSMAMCAAIDAPGIEFFEKKIRPLLADRCYKCHSQQSEKVRGGLLLDSKEGVLKGGDTGPALIPGDVENSLLIKAVRYADENLQMPPKGKRLAAEQIAELEEWVRMGAPDPRDSQVPSSKSEVQSSQHWAFQPIQSPPIPSVKNKRWPKTTVDRFILAKLEANNISPSPMADKRTLLRRATFDLTGLPPTLGEVEAFLQDKSPEAFARVVDRLLASPRYGERWGRHWLDVARYADTKGYLAGNQERKFAYSYTYRDYVIRAFNEDLPYDQFLIQQIAADRLDLGEDKRPLAALGFLTLGRQFLGNIHDITDDRIDVVTRGTMALTVACARCHDHKFDPIPTKDYYSLYGIFTSSSEPSERPLLGISPPENLRIEYQTEKEKREEAVKSFREKKTSEILSTLRIKTGDYMFAALDTQRLPDKSKSETLARERKLDPGVVQRWVNSLATWSNATNPIFAPWFEFASIPETNFTSQAGAITESFSAKAFLNPIVANAFTNTPASIKEVGERYGKIFAETERLWQEATAATGTNQETAGVTSLADPSRESLRTVLYGPDAPANLGNVEGIFDVPSIERLRELRRQVAELDAVHPGAPPRAMAMVDNPKPGNAQIFIRGNPGNRGAEVPRRFLTVLAGENAKPFENGSGRLELAQAIASRENPLTSRVLVNRVWLLHFGKGLAETPSDFGVRSELPSHPELLDYLSWNFMEQGWSLKKLHREIMLSSVYRQSSDDDPRSAKLDPENKLLWKMNRQRLDFEELRDSLLAVAEKLDTKAGGHSVDIASEPFSNRRSVYGFIDRQNLPGIFRTFDFPNPDTSSSHRFFTTVPQQALFLLNNGFVVAQARGLTTNATFTESPRDEARTAFLYERIFQRAPDKMELKAADQFLKTQGTIASNSFVPPVWQYGFGEYLTEKNTTRFTPLTFFTNQQWQASEKFPDPNLGHVTLSASAGHPGNDSGHSVIRRWISPLDGIVRIEGTLEHPSDKGDGVLGRIVSSRKGELGQWVAQNGKAVTSVAECEVRRGDTIDFITEVRANSNYDSFQWSPTLNLVKVQYGTVAPARNNWSAQNDFEGPLKTPKSLNAWEKYAQVLLLSNEFMFVD